MATENRSPDGFAGNPEGCTYGEIGDIVDIARELRNRDGLSFLSEDALPNMWQKQYDQTEVNSVLKASSKAIKAFKSRQ